DTAAGTGRPSAADETSDRGGETGEGRTEEAEGDEADAGPDPSLLSDEERVERLLEGNGGRMRQAAIVEETGWSDAKVSQLLSAMAEEGRVEKLRLGRENLISLPDEGIGTGGGASATGDGDENADDGGRDANGDEPT
ncbi:helix-turn-helix domain-containing protein, partial [Halorubrum sp. CBA1125]|uniref:helix-turn-helix transcriptional regulator n=1 Tax=Halorubrum sp. CBA1125 TaxID=2668072 RepID=UPI0031B718C2